MKYSKKVIELFMNPKNVGEINNPDGEAEVGNPICGDVMKIQLKVENNRITDIKFRTFGCGAAIASSSMLTELVKGKTLEEAEKVTYDVLVKTLGGLPPQKIHCTNLAIETLHEAIKDCIEKQSAENAPG